MGRPTELFPVDPVLRLATCSVLAVQKTWCTGVRLGAPLTCVGCPSVDSLKECLSPDSGPNQHTQERTC